MPAVSADGGVGFRRGMLLVVEGPACGSGAQSSNRATFGLASAATSGGAKLALDSAPQQAPPPLDALLRIVSAPPDIHFALSRYPYSMSHAR